MRRRSIPRAGEAWRFRRQCDSRIGIIIIAGEQSFAAALTSDAHIGNEIICAGAGDAVYRYATVAVAVKDSAFVIYRNFIEVEQVAIFGAAALLPDAGHALHRIVRS